MVILFLHGWNSVVGGVKPSFLQEAGHKVINPRLDHDDFEQAVRVAQDCFDQYRPSVIVGSSRGGAVAMNLQAERTPRVLLCPAWKRWGKLKKLTSRTVILHSRADDVIPFADSQELLDNSLMDRQALIETGNDHRLADPASLAAMLWACELFESGELLPWEMERDETSERVANSQTDGSYICDSCGEEIVVPLDVSEGSSQTYTEDCPVCCHANVIHVEFDRDGRVFIYAHSEQDFS